MQSETMAIGASGETMVEDTGEILWRNADTIIDDGYAHPLVGVGYSNSQALIGYRRVGAGLFGIADEVDQDLQGFVLFDEDFRLIVKFSNQLDVVFAQAARGHPQGIFD